MSRAAFALGFGFGRANQEIADLVVERNASHPFEHILIQYALLPYFAGRLAYPPVEEMHTHSRIYVHTLDAIGLGIRKLYRIAARPSPLVVEIFAHGLQADRAYATAGMALRLFSRTPRPAGKPDLCLQFIEEIRLRRGNPASRMRMNRVRESLRQLWTCSERLYRIMESIAAERDLNLEQSPYGRHSSLFYDHILELEKRLDQEVKKSPRVVS